MMKILHTLLTMMVTLTCVHALAEVPAKELPLPVLNISDRGELIFQDDDFSFAPWSSDTSPGKVHVVQYFGATMSASKIYEPFTNLLQAEMAPSSYHVTTIINLDAALWGTTGFVVSELKKNKRKHPLATMVVDEEGAGVDQWGLGDNGAGLVVIDSQGKVRYFTTEAMNAQEMSATLAIVQASTDG